MKIIRKPEWLQKRISPGSHAEMERLLGDLRLHTVCQEALCPNISECFSQKQATFLIMGNACTRLCTFCNVRQETPLPIDPEEPVRVAAAVERLGLAHVVITSPTRDDLPDGGAGHYAATVMAMRTISPATRIELLAPDFQGSRDSLATVLAAAPDIFGHNLETVPRLYEIRKGADYRRSLQLLAAAGEAAPSIPTKSGIMLGLGEGLDEVRSVMSDLRSAGCSYLSIGQYLAPSRNHQPVLEFVKPEIFDLLRTEGLALGFSHVESGPYVRSSYHAGSYTD
ncbi:lipoyl synthase [Geobacter pelophilus]|uniref:Lipoyl synthase n=1 Tax=Geoanaerobacter pelophilus TaxID=60036 RepID=A0AAW4LAA0_9BACT|nr:lipoyl synthase [Geoanaerobacter pelophilus]MBT0665256.1 lipoyl synthase [Geoanaerobacter pelophilus]